MITFSKEFDNYTIQRPGGSENWLSTVKALLAAIAKQDPEDPLSTSETTNICWLIEDMLPNDEQVFKIEQEESELHKISALITESKSINEKTDNFINEVSAVIEGERNK